MDSAVHELIVEILKAKGNTNPSEADVVHHLHKYGVPKKVDATDQSYVRMVHAVIVEEPKPESLLQKLKPKKK